MPYNVDLGRSNSFGKINDLLQTTSIQGFQIVSSPDRQSTVLSFAKLCSASTKWQCFSVGPPLFEEASVMKWSAKVCGYTVPLIKQVLYVFCPAFVDHIWVV